MDDAQDELFDLSAKSTLRRYMADIWERRAFAVVVPANDIRAQNMDTLLGQFWHLLNPLLMAAVYYLIFGVILDASRGVSNYLGFLIVGVFVFQLTQRVVQDGSITIDRNKSLIRSISFPRALLPLSSANAQSFAFVPALVVMVVVVGLSGDVLSSRLVFLLPILVMHYLINLGFALIAARIGSQISDVSQILPHLFRLLFYMSGVLFSVDAYVQSEFWKRVMAANPIYDVITCARWSLMGLPLRTDVVVGALAWATFAPALGFAVFRSAEHRYGA
jgi:teichoic acid transport system permease protein